MIVTLCGSARFEPLFHAWNEALTFCGHAVFGLTVYPSQRGGKREWYNSEEKALLDKAHRAKIAASNAALILNRFGYVGDSTLGELEFAEDSGLEVYCLESWGEGCGVGPSHTVPEIKLKDACRIPANYVSPLNTVSHHAGLYSHLFTLPAGPLRNRLVNSLAEANRHPAVESISE